MNFAFGNNKPKKAVIYLRVSTEEQVDNFSLGNQEETCKKEAIRRGYEVVQIFKEEGKSAKNIIGRPILIEMLEYCRKNKKDLGAIFVYRLDRISRQTSDFLSIRKKLTECGISLLSASEPTGDSPTERFIETILASSAQLDNDIRGERTRNGLRARFLAGLIRGPAPLGYLNQNGYVIKDPDSFGHVQKAWELMATGTKTLSEIANIMNYWGLGIVKKGRKYPLRSQATSRLFRNKFYLGILTSERYPEEVRGQHTPMVTEEQFYQVQAIIDKRNTNITAPTTRRSRDNSEFPLRRIARCGKCGMVLTGGWSKGRSCKYGYYVCRARCGSSSISMNDLHKGMLDLLKSVNPTPECLELFITLLRSTYMNKLKMLQNRKAEADVELAKLYSLRQALIEKNLTGVYSDEMFKQQNAVIEDKITALQLAKSDALIDKYNLEKVINFMKVTFGDLGRTYENSSLDQKRVLLGSIFPSGVSWSYPGFTNQDISPLYQAILNVQTVQSPFGTAYGSRTRDFWDENPTS